MHNSIGNKGIVKLVMAFAIGLCVFGPQKIFAFQSNNPVIENWHIALPISPDHMSEYLVGDALQFEFDGDEVKCGGELSNVQLISLEEDAAHAGVFTAVLKTNLSLPVRYCESEVTKSCEVTVLIDGRQFQTLDWICDEN